MEADERAAFEDYILHTFPEEKKRTRSAVIHRSLAQRIIDHLKGNPEENKAFHHYVKKTGFSLLSLPAAGLRDVLVIPVRKGEEVSQ